MRARTFGRVLWTRALPGSVAVVAALTIPEFSVGAGDLEGGKRRDKPIDPDAATGQTGVKRAADAASNPLAGVRYGGLIAINDPHTISAAKPRIVDPALAAISINDVRLAQIPPEAVSAPPSRDAALPKASLTTRVPLSVVSEAAQALDQAASYSVAVLDRFAVPPGKLPGSPSVNETIPERPKAAKVNPLDMAAGYAAATIERFVSAPVVAPEIAGGAVLVVELASTPLPEAGETDERIAELAPLPVPTEFAGEPGLAPPRADPVPAAAAPEPKSAMTQIAALPRAAALAAPPKPPAAIAAPVAASGAGFALDIKSQLVTRVDGKAAGTVDFQQTVAGLSIRLGSIAEVLGDRFAPAEIARIQSSAAANAYLSLAELQAQGISISYDPVYDEFNVGNTDTRPKAARKVHMDQISTPERGLGTAVIDQVRR